MASYFSISPRPPRAAAGRTAFATFATSSRATTGFGISAGTTFAWWWNGFTIGIARCFPSAYLHCGGHYGRHDSEGLVVPCRVDSPEGCQDEHCYEGEDLDFKDHEEVHQVDTPDSVHKERGKMSS
jgi:hypothetical protein